LASSGASRFEKLELIPISYVDWLNPVRKSSDLLGLIPSEESLSVPESMSEGNFASTSPSPQSLSRDFEDSGDVGGGKVLDAINFHWIQ
jgi:hypothetical protein